MIAGLTADISITLAHEAKLKWLEENPGVCFLPE